MTTRLLDHKLPIYCWTTYILIALIIPFHGITFAAPSLAADAGHIYYVNENGNSHTQGGAFVDRDSQAAAAQTPPAFPGAEGFGANTVGGRGGKIFEVTNLNDSGSGSLRACVEASGARTCIFRTGGLIQLKSALRIANPYITIAGQTAPGGGITLKTVSGGDALTIGTHDVIIRYMTFRPGPGGENHGTEIAANGVHLYNIMIDHCSFSWGTDEVLETWYKVSDTTIQWSIVSEGLDCSTHSKGCHSKGLMVGGYADSENGTGLGSENISVHHNLFAHNGERNPLVQTSGLVDVVNNVAYNPFGTFMYLYMKSKSVVPVNYVGNYYKYGPETSSGKYEIKTYDDGGTGAQIYVSGNIGPHRTSDSQAQQNVVDTTSRTYITQTRFSAPTVTTTSAAEAYKQVLAASGSNAGLSCNGAWVDRRDTIDARIVKDVTNGTGAIIDDPSQVGGWITPASGTPCQDADHDGMPDGWEAKYGLDPKSNADAVADLDRDGYTNVEEYINATDPSSKEGSPTPPTGTAGAGLYDDTASYWSYSGTWTSYTGTEPYNNTLHYTNTIGNEAQFSFNGVKFILGYVKASNRGRIDVYVDGNKIDTINANNSTTVWQAAWSSPTFTAGVHTVRFVHVGGGTYIDVDSLQVLASVDTAAPAAINTLAATSGTTAGTVNLSWTAVGDDGSSGTAAGYLVRYGTSAITTEAAWNAATPVTAGIPTPAAAGAPQTMTVSGLTSGATSFFAVRAQDEAGNLGGVSNSASAAAQGATGVPAGIYDDTDVNWVYTGAWTAYRGTGPYNGTSHYSSAGGSEARITINGAKFIFTYVKASNRGLIDVYVDGSRIATLNARTNTTTWQATWTSPSLTPGVHILRFVYAGGTYIDVDAIQVFGALAGGSYDDANPNWTYTGTWTSYTGTGPVSDTDHYTNVAGNEAQITFTGTGFTFTYVKASNRGSIDVYIDGTRVGTINAKSSTTAWQQVWTSPKLTSGTHTVRFIHAGSGTYIDVDAITVMP